MRTAVKRPRLYALIFGAAAGSVLLNGALGANSVVVTLLDTVWTLAPYLVLSAVMAIAEKRTSLLATAVATLLGAVGALVPAVMTRMFEAGVDVRLVPIPQAMAIAVLLPICKVIVTRFDARPPSGRDADDR